MKLASFLLLLPLVACGGGGTAPALSALMVSTSSVTRGMTYNGTANVEDPDSLVGLKLELAFTGPTPATTSVDVAGISSGMTSATLPFVFGLTAGVMPGSYTLGITAIDKDGLRSNTLSTALEVQ
jgi:hypothetical protein